MNDLLITIKTAVEAAAAVSLTLDRAAEALAYAGTPETAVADILDEIRDVEPLALIP